MAPPEFFIRLQNGITGGFAPPTPNAIYSVSRSEDAPDVISVQTAERADGTPELVGSDLRTVPIKESTHDASIDELVKILSDLPTEEPPNSQDIYGLDTQIWFGSEVLEWRNGGPSGSEVIESTVKATPEQKAAFKRAVEIITKIAKS